MKRVVFFVFIAHLAYGQMSVKNYVGVETKYYPHTSMQKYNMATTFQNQSKYTSKYFNLYARIDALKDFKDKKRDQFLINELYVLKSYENFDISIGREILFLGALEGYNMVNFINPQNYKKDMFQTHKIGSCMASIRYYFENESDVAFYVKASQREVKYASKEYEVYPFLDKDYDEHIIYEDKNKPDFLLTYGFSLSEDEFSGDFTFGVYHGQGQTIPVLRQDIYRFYAFKSSKLFTYDNLAIGNWLFKFEGILTDEKNMQDGDFYDVGLGTEYTITNIFNSHSLGVVGEYYRSDFALNSLNNDIFIALRYSLNDADSSEFLLGFTKNMENANSGAYLKYEGRVYENIKLSSDFRYQNANDKEIVKLGLEFKYYF